MFRNLVYGWKDGQKDGWMGKRKGRYINGWMDRKVEECIHGYMLFNLCFPAYEWIENGWRYGWRYGWIGGQIYGQIDKCRDG